jgi:hypothetical protein
VIPHCHCTLWREFKMTFSSYHISEEICNSVSDLLRFVFGHILIRVIMSW